MIKKIIISSLNNIAAIIHNNKIQEIIIINNTYQVNDIYIGKVQKIFTSINAAFVQLNYHDKSGFIHVNDIKIGHNTTNPQNILDTITIQQKLLVQIIKEPTKIKGPRLTTNIHLSGKYLILMPFNNIVCIANKIYDENERSFLRALGILIKPATMGLLFKESSTGINEILLIEDLQNLKKQWNFIQKAAIHKPCPSLLYKDDAIISKIIRDFCDSDVESIIIDSKDGFKNLYKNLSTRKNIGYLEHITLQLYQRKICMLEKFSINSTIFNALQTKVELQPGIYIFIESLEALTVIDVNSGSFNQGSNSNNSILRTNFLAANEIAYQLKIRNLNGIILIDFIDMKSYKDQLKLLEHLNKILKMDNARPEIIQLSELGLVELTRRRRGQSIFEIFNNDVKNMDLTYSTDLITSEEYISNVNAIFFKKRFKKTIKLKQWNSDLTSNTLMTINLVPVHHRYIMPITLYHFTLGCTVHLS